MPTVTEMERRANKLVQDHIGGAGTTGPVRDPSVVAGVPDPGDIRPRSDRAFARALYDDPVTKERVGRTIEVTTPQPPPVEEVELSFVDLRSSVAMTSFGTYSLNELEHAGVCRIVLEAVARRWNESIDILRESTGVNELERKSNEQIEVMRQNLVAQAAKEAASAKKAAPPTTPQIVKAEVVAPEVTEKNKK